MGGLEKRVGFRGRCLQKNPPDRYGWLRPSLCEAHRGSRPTLSRLNIGNSTSSTYPGKSSSFSWPRAALARSCSPNQATPAWPRTPEINAQAMQLARGPGSGPSVNEQAVNELWKTASNNVICAITSGVFSKKKLGNQSEFRRAHHKASQFLRVHIGVKLACAVYIRD